MPPLPVISGKVAIKVFESIGYEQRRQTGSHVHMFHPMPKYKRVSVPLHRELKAGTLRSIIRGSGVTVDEFVKAYRRI